MFHPDMCFQINPNCSAVHVVLYLVTVCAILKILFTFCFHSYIQLNLLKFVHVPHGLGKMNYFSGLIQCSLADACLSNCTVASQKTIQCKVKLHLTVTLM